MRMPVAKGEKGGKGEGRKILNKIDFFCHPRHFRWQKPRKRERNTLPFFQLHAFRSFVNSF